jgi:DNA-binding response OmpR family regulator
MTDMLPPTTSILVIDDDPDLLLLLSKMLARIGASARAVETGREGLALLENEPFDLLVLDLMLPDIDGFEVLRQVRAEPRYDAMPVLILSARGETSAVSRGIELGADSYLTKPYLPNALTSRVRTLLTQERHSDE